MEILRAERTEDKVAEGENVGLGNFMSAPLLIKLSAARSRCGTECTSFLTITHNIGGLSLTGSLIVKEQNVLRYYSFISSYWNMYSFVIFSITL